MNMFSLKRLLVGLVAIGLSTTLAIPSVLADHATWNPNPPVKFRYGANGYPSNPSSKPDAYIAMYDVTPVTNGLYAGRLVSVKRQINGVLPTFTVRAGRVVNFVAFSNRLKAFRSTKWSFTTPPYKNFGDGNNILCQINFLNQYQKLQSNGTDSCAYGSGTSPLSDSYLGFADGAYGLPASQVGNFEAWVMETSDPTSLVKNAYVTLYDASGRQIAAVGTGTRGIATFVLQRGTQFYLQAEKDGRQFGGRTKVYYPGQTALEYISSDGKKLISAYDGGSTSVMRLNVYPQQGQQPTYLSTPTIYTPTQNQIIDRNSGSLSIDWSDVSGATSYDYVVECGDCSYPQWNTNYGVTTVPNSYTALAYLPADRELRLHVRARNNSSVGQWSEYRYFKLRNAQRDIFPDTPTIVSPSIGAVLKYNNVNLTWTAESGATLYDYEIQCSTCGSPQWSVSYGMKTVKTNNNNAQMDTLPMGQTFRVRVRAVNTNNYASQWSEYRYFSTSTQFGLSAPEINSPQYGSLFGNLPRRTYLNWTSVENATGYEYEIFCTQCSSSNNGLLSYGVVYSATTTATADALPADTEYMVRVRAVLNGVPGPWSQNRYFRYQSAR